VRARRVLGGLLGLAVAWTAGTSESAAPGPGTGEGVRVYAAHCAVCHGERGDGRGEAAGRFATAPRDFTTGRYKIRSTPSGQPPTDDDLRRSIVRGLPGTAMVPQDQLTDGELRAVIDHLRSLSPRFATGRLPRPIPIPPAPPRSGDAVARGRQAYEKGECAECHGPEARGDGPSARDLRIKPPDLTRRPFKGGSTPRDILRTLLTGFDGTPMPSYHQVLEDDELWDLAFYIESLATPPVLTGDERLGWEVVGRPPRTRP
jgi:mono/diheme cytochrome c family protein